MLRHPTPFACRCVHAAADTAPYESVGSSTSSIEPCTNPAHS